MATDSKIHEWEYLVRTNIELDDWVDEDQLRRLIEGLGGVHTKQGYAFPTRQRRSVALDLIAERYGSRYVTVVSD
ncbi:MAG: hypothetical protein DWQ42_03710 [Planctomycetota bacterium]|nr:MAG: hypothetical protein DWQ42_03710 [Planctomycetota bacterium]